MTTHIKSPFFYYYYFLAFKQSVSENSPKVRLAFSVAVFIPFFDPLIPLFLLPICMRSVCMRFVSACSSSVTRTGFDYKFPSRENKHHLSVFVFFNAEFTKRRIIQGKRELGSDHHETGYLVKKFNLITTIG